MYKLMYNCMYELIEIFYARKKYNFRKKRVRFNHNDCNEFIKINFLILKNIKYLDF